MKKLMVFGVSLINLMLIFLFFSLVSAVRINEIELNPEGTDSGNEWIELYSEQNIDLNGWKLVNNDNKVINLSQNFNGYLIINFSGQWLDNSNESLKLFNDLSLVDSTPKLEDNYNNEKTWQYCSGDWTFIASTKNSANSCSSQSQSQTPTQNNSQNNTPNTQQEAKISLEADWDEESIINGEEFEIEVKAFNLKDESHNLRIWVEFKDNGTIISDRYDNENDEWKSGTYYVDNFFDREGNKTKGIKLRIRDSYKNFKGDAALKAKLESEDYLLEKDIEILEKETTEEEQKQDDTAKTNSTILSTTSSIKQTDNIIRLVNTKRLQEQNNTKEENKVLYESSGEKVKKYAIYALNVILIVIIILLIKKKV